MLVFIGKLMHLVFQLLILQSEVFHLLFVSIHLVNFLTIRMIQFLIFLLHYDEFTLISEYENYLCCCCCWARLFL